MTTEVEKIVYGRMDIKESLCLSARFKTAHTSLSYASRLMRKLSSIVRILRRVVNGLRHQFPISHTVSFQLIRHDCA